MFQWQSNMLLKSLEPRKYRLVSLKIIRPPSLRHKVGASVAAVRRGGGMTTVDTMNHFMLNKEMIVVGSTYWNMVYGKNVGDALSDDEGMANMRNLGENMSFILKRIRLLKE